jgi:hypothetical protein
VGVSLALPWAFALGEILTASRLRVCVGLLTCVRACGASQVSVWHLTLPLGCHCPPDALWMDTASILTLQLWLRGLPAVLGIAPILDPVQPGLTGDMLRRFMCGFTFVTHGELRLVDHPRQARRMPTFLTPACGLVRGHRGVGSLFPPRGRELHPHVKQFRRFCVRHILISIYITYVSRQLVAPKSHVGLFSEGGLNSYRNPAPQSI